MDFLNKLRNLPESQRKIILWTAVIILSLVLFVWWVRNVKENLRSFQKEEFREQLQFPSFQEELQRLPKIEMPEIEIPEVSEEELKQLEGQLKALEYGE